MSSRNAHEEEEIATRGQFAKPVEGGYKVWAVMTPGEMDATRSVQEGMQERAVEELRNGDPMVAAHMAIAARVLRRLSISVEVDEMASRKPERPRVPEAPEASGPQPAKVKHIYDDSGFCIANHDGKQACGLPRTRRARRVPAATVPAGKEKGHYAEQLLIKANSQEREEG